MKNAKLMRALPELMKNWPCGMLPRSFVAKAPLDDNKGEKKYSVELYVLSGERKSVVKKQER